MASTRAQWRVNTSLAVIRSARRLFARTPIEKIPFTTTIKARVFRFGNTGAEVTTNFRGVQLTVPTKDTIIAPGLVGGFYEKIELDVFERLAAMSETIVDVGANIGLYCSVAAHRAPVTGKIVAFEPVPENVRYLRRNLEENELTARVVVEEQGVGHASGEMQLYLLDGSTCRHSPSAKNVRNSRTSITVPMVSLDDYVRQNLRDRSIDVLKVDVEGYEGAVLRGARKTLNRDRPTLFIEFVPGNLANCNLPPEEFLEMIFELYDDVFLVDEPRATVRACSKGELLRSSVRRYRHMNANLIAVSKSSRRAHHEIIELTRDAHNSR